MNIEKKDDDEGLTVNLPWLREWEMLMGKMRHNNEGTKGIFFYSIVKTKKKGKKDIIY